MYDENWEMIDGEAAHEIEVLNQSNVINVVEAILKWSKHHDKGPGPGCSRFPNVIALQELHRAGTFLLLQRPGAYRTIQVFVLRRDRENYTPPAPEAVQALTEAFVADIQKMWTGTATAVEVAAFALWRINWIHPFLNGNGRTARAFAYLCVCLRFGLMLPGTNTLIDLIMNDRAEYEAALAHADDTFEKQGEADLAPMEAYVDRLLRVQIASVPAAEEEAQSA
jgi:Fic family protein